MARTAISKKLRFEIFKRDSFACQYCGKKAPDIILELDHVVPVAAGGGTDILNLTTSCRDCNSGKSDRPLHENTVLDKQRAQLEELNERRVQIEMMVRWRDELGELDEIQLRAIADRMESKTGCTMTETGKRDTRKWLKKYGFAEVLAALETALAEIHEAMTMESKIAQLNRVPKILRGRAIVAEKPYMREIFYIRGILRNRLSGFNQSEAVRLLERAHLSGADLFQMSEAAKTVKSWTQFCDCINHYTTQ